ncbi:MAG: F0F1 ATP synthase subunit delta [Pseudomonadota bacterium]
MSQSTSLTASVAGRYATALFELASDAGTLETVEQDAAALTAALADSAELTSVIRSPVYGRDEQGAAMAAMAQAMGLSDTMRNLMGLMAAKRRLFVLPEVLEIFGELLAEHRGEVTADVTAARLLSDAQIESIKSTLAASLSRQVKLNITIDPAILGGLIVKVGSRMIDTSLRSKLNGLQNAMREVG